ncbi:MAG: hypothetical protein KTR25_07820 [Myxococcales bacterium]|nr:hypothetical protein [Myxococcales bacterium]
MSTATVAIIVAAQLLLWAARVPIHRLLQSLSRGVRNTTRLIGHWFSGQATELQTRNRDILRYTALEDRGRKVSHKLEAIGFDFSQDIAEYRKLQRDFSDLLRKMEDDYAEAGVAPVEAPGWVETLGAASNISGMESKTAQRALAELRRSAEASEKRALTDFRQMSARRHRILGKMAPSMAKSASLLAKVGDTMTRVSASTSQLGEHISGFHEIREASVVSDRTLQRLAWHTFITSLLVFAVAVGGGAINFQLIALPMAELVPTVARISGISVSTVAALVIVLLEVTAGMFLMEMLGVTRLFPNLQTLPRSRQRLILAIAVFGLFILASVEASLAVLREQIVAAENALSLSLAGAQVADDPSTSNIPMIGQAVLGFVLPWILAMAAIPLELLITSGGVVMTAIFAMLLLTIGGIVRISGYGLCQMLSVLHYIYDTCIAVPLAIEHLLFRRGAKKPDNSVENRTDSDESPPLKITKIKAQS